MPTYEELEQSGSQSQPVEAYEFVGSFRTYRYTSSDRIINVGGNNYDPVAVTRSRLQAGTYEDDNLSLDLELPFNLDVVQDYAFSESPPSLALTVYRQQQQADDTNFVIYWSGEVRGFTVSDRVAKIQVPSVFSLALQGELPSVYYQTPCNHVLYSGRCGALAADHDFAAQVQSVLGTAITLTTIPTATGELASGELVNDRNGERRMILSNSGNAIEIGYSFVDLIPGDTVTLYRGCDHSFETCRLKFDNAINFGGYPYIPAENPFQGDVG